MELNNGFPVLYADPPWAYDNPQDHDPTRGGTPYSQLSVRDLCALRPLVDKVVSKDSVLLLWATMPKLPDALQLMAAWGYKYTCCPWVWVKLNPTGAVWQPTKNHVAINTEDASGIGIKSKDVLLQGGVYSGMGSWVNGNAEIVLMGKRGRGCPRQSKSVKQIVFAPRGAHSAKPEEVRTRINQVFGDIPGIELFARPPKTKGWLKLGFEMDELDIREALEGLSKGD